jgi:hypothetical protein
MVLWCLIDNSRASEISTLGLYNEPLTTPSRSISSVPAKRVNCRPLRKVSTANRRRDVCGGTRGGRIIVVQRAAGRGSTGR